RRFWQIDLRAVPGEDRILEEHCADERTARQVVRETRSDIATEARDVIPSELAGGHRGAEQVAAGVDAAIVDFDVAPALGAQRCAAEIDPDVPSRIEVGLICIPHPGDHRDPEIRLNGCDHCTYSTKDLALHSGLLVAGSLQSSGQSLHHAFVYAN